jgi:hypothetical protein
MRTLVIRITQLVGLLVVLSLYLIVVTRGRPIDWVNW